MPSGMKLLQPGSLLPEATGLLLKPQPQQLLNGAQLLSRLLLPLAIGALLRLLLLHQLLAIGVLLSQPRTLVQTSRRDHNVTQIIHVWANALHLSSRPQYMEHHGASDKTFAHAGILTDLVTHRTNCASKACRVVHQLLYFLLLALHASLQSFLCLLQHFDLCRTCCCLLLKIQKQLGPWLQKVPSQVKNSS